VRQHVVQIVDVSHYEEKKKKKKKEADVLEKKKRVERIFSSFLPDVHGKLLSDKSVTIVG